MARLDVHPLPKGSYWTSSPYGPRGSGFHRGIDLAAPGGTPIYAPWSGLVNQAWDSGGGGNWTNLWADDGDMLGFGHASHFADNPLTLALDTYNGRRIIAGTILAYVGTTGQSSGNHLHLAYKPAGSSSYVDPTGLVRDAERANRFAGAGAVLPSVDPTAPPPPPQEDPEVTDQEIEKVAQRVVALLGANKAGDNPHSVAALQEQVGAAANKTIDAVNIAADRVVRRLGENADGDNAFSIAEVFMRVDKP